MSLQPFPVLGIASEAWRPGLVESTATVVQDRRVVA